MSIERIWWPASSKKKALVSPIFWPMRKMRRGVRTTASTTVGLDTSTSRASASSSTIAALLSARFMCSLMVAPGCVAIETTFAFTGGCAAFAGAGLCVAAVATPVTQVAAARTPAIIPFRIAELLLLLRRIGARDSVTDDGNTLVFVSTCAGIEFFRFGFLFFQRGHDRRRILRSQRTQRERHRAGGLCLLDHLCLCGRQFERRALGEYGLLIVVFLERLIDGKHADI